MFCALRQESPPPFFCHKSPLSAPHVAPWPVPAIVEVGKFRDEHRMILPSYWTPTHSRRVCGLPGKPQELWAWGEPSPARRPALRPAPGEGEEGWTSEPVQADSQGRGHRQSVRAGRR